MKVQVPFLVLCLAAFTNLDVVLGAPASGVNNGQVSTSLGQEPVKLAAGGHGGQESTFHTQTNRLMSPQEQALHGFPHRPESEAQVKAIPEEDLKKITHEQHLEKLDADGALEMAGRVVDYANNHMKTRQKAYDGIVNHGGIPGKMDSGKSGADQHHINYANAMKELYQLKGPLTAVEHRANLTGERSAANTAFRLKKAIDYDWKSPQQKDQKFIDHVGPASIYHQSSVDDLGEETNIKTPQEAWKSRPMSEVEKEALDGFKSRPNTLDHAIAIPSRDFHKITHQDHLHQLDADGAKHLAVRVTDQAHSHLNHRKSTFKAIESNGGEPGMTGTGKAEAQVHHTQYANAQKELNLLKAPLMAVEQAANLKGELEAGGAAYRAKDAIDEKTWGSSQKTNKDFKDHVGSASVYYPYEMYNHKPNQVEDTVKKGTDNKATESKVANSRL